MPLTSPLLLVLLAVIAEALLFLALRRGTETSLVVRGTSGAVAVILLLAGAAAWTNDHYGLYRSWRDLLGVHSPDLVAISNPNSLARVVAPTQSQANAKHGTLLELDIPGPLSGVKPRHAFVYLPPQYRDPLYASTSFPVVEAFQGSPGRPSDWILGLHLEQEMDRAIAFGTVSPAIVVMPDTNGGLSRSLECTNTVDGKHDETFLVADVRSWMSRTFRIRPGRWVTMGYSTGGYCALDLTVRHPQDYASAISLDGYAHAISDGYARHLWTSAQDRLEHSPDWWVAHHRPENVNFYLLAGRDDQSSVSEATRFWSLLGQTGWRRPHDALVAQPRGRHTFPAWQAAIQPALEWALPGINAARTQVFPVPIFATPPTPSHTPTALPHRTPTPTPTPTPRATASLPAKPRTTASPTRTPRPSPSPSPTR